MLKLAIYEDNHSLRETLVGFLGMYDRYEIVGNYPNGNDAILNTKNFPPDIAVVDIDMPGTNGIVCTQKIKETRPETQILIHTVFEDDNNLFEALCAGANGYILKSSTPEQLLQAITDLENGGAPMSPIIAKKVIQVFSNPKSLTEKQLGNAQNEVKHSGMEQYALTVREKDILELLVKGFSYKMIAKECEIGIETVKTHLKNIYSKLQVNCGTEAVAKAIQNQII